MKQILIILGLFASITTFAQSPRIKLNQITKDTVKGSVLISSPSDSGMVYSRDFYVAYGLTDTVLILYGDTLAATSGIISSVLSDGVTITGNGTIGNELKVDTSLIVTINALNDSLATISASTTPDGVTITGDGSVGNPLKVDTATVISTIKGLVDTLSARGYLSVVQLTDTLDANTRGFLTAEVDGSISNELQTISTSGAAGNITLSDGGGTLNLNVDDADASATNEGSLTVGAGTATTSLISSNTSGSTDVTLTAGSNITLSETGNNITIAASGGGTTYNNITETADTVFIAKYLDVDTSTLYVDATTNRVGIGTSTPQAPLSVAGSIHMLDVNQADGTDNTLYIYNDDDAASSSGLTDAEFFMMVAKKGSTSTANGPYFLMRGNDWSRGTNQDGRIIFAAGTGFASPTGNDGVIDFITNGGSLKIEYDGDVVMTDNAYIQGTTLVTSDINLKNNVNDYYNGLDKIMNLRPVSFYLNNDKENILNFGFIAQDVQEILPELVRRNNNTSSLYLNYDNFIPILVNGIKEQQAIIETQSTEIDQLKTLITDLTNRLIILENK